MSGKLAGIFKGSERGVAKRPVLSADLIAGEGISGDVHAGLKESRQVSLFSAEVLEEINSSGIDVAMDDLSANLLTKDFELDSIPVGARLAIGPAVIEISESRKPCGSLTKIDKRLPKAAYTRCGKFGRVIVGGLVRVGDDVEMVI